MHFHLATFTDGPCSACQHFGHWVSGTAAVWCLHGKIVNGMPQHGCAYWRAKQTPSPADGGKGVGAAENTAAA